MPKREQTRRSFYKSARPIKELGEAPKVRKRRSPPKYHGSKPRNENVGDAVEREPGGRSGGDGASGSLGRQRDQRAGEDDHGRRVSRLRQRLGKERHKVGKRARKGRVVSSLATGFYVLAYYDNPEATVCKLISHRKYLIRSCCAYYNYIQVDGRAIAVDAHRADVQNKRGSPRDGHRESGRPVRG